MNKTESGKKPKSRMDLSALDSLSLTELGTGAGMRAEKSADPDKSPATAVPSGEPLQLAIDLVVEDPTQPRKHFDQQALDELTDSIRSSGIKSPISVKPANAAGLYIVNFGARRLRAAKAAGLTTVPAFIDAAHDYWHQAAENLQREGFTILEQVAIVKHGLDQGMSQVDIARKLNKSKTYVSKFAALVKVPAFMADAANAGRIDSHDALYDLATFLKKNPDRERQVQAFVAGEGIITRQSVLELIQGLKKPEGAGEKPTSGTTAEKVEAADPAVAEVSTSKLSDANQSDEGRTLIPRFTEPHGAPRPPTTEHAPTKKPAVVGAEGAKDSAADGDVRAVAIEASKEPVLKFRQGSRRGSVNLWVTVDYGFVMVRFEGDDHDERVRASDIELVALLSQ